MSIQAMRFDRNNRVTKWTCKKSNRSDHASFWQYHYPALMITDTAPFRYPWYHHPDDTPDKIDYNRLARVVDGLEKTFDDLAGIAP
jgi:hypothetical protein